jgi:hypothetical protein
MVNPSLERNWRMSKAHWEHRAHEILRYLTTNTPALIEAHKISPSRRWVARGNTSFAVKRAIAVFEGFVTWIRFSSQEMTVEDCFNRYCQELEEVFGHEIVEYAKTAVQLGWEI